MKKVIYTLFVLITICTSTSAQVVMGDMNGDGKLTMVDVSKTIDALSGKSTNRYVTKYAVDNKSLEGVWWRSRNESITFKTDSTTDYSAGYKYCYIPELHAILLRNASGVACELIDAQMKDGTLVLQRGENAIAETYYSERPPQYVSGIALFSSSEIIKIGESKTLSATVTPADASNPSVTWSSSDEKVATVSAEGVVTAVSRGTATITVTAADGSGVSATCQVTVPLLVSEIALSATELNLIEGDTKTLKATVTPTDANDTSVIWSSSDESVATVSNSGLVTAVGAGTATITVTAADGGGAKASCVVSVEALIPVTGIVLSKTETTIDLGKEETITATLSPDNAQHKTLTWKSSDTRIATVDKNGVVHAQGIGTATITATSADEPTVSATCTVTVTGTYRMYFGNIDYTGGDLPVGEYSKDGTITDGEHFNYIDLQNKLLKAYEVSSTSNFVIKITRVDDYELEDQPYIYILVPRGLTLYGYYSYMNFSWNCDTYQTPQVDSYEINGIMYDKFEINSGFKYIYWPTIEILCFTTR